jgi:hypothetical protein
MNPSENNMEDPKIPHHDTLRNEDAFRVPAFYFESFQDRIMKRIENEMIPPALKDNVFTVPDEYFDTFTDRLMNKIHPVQKPKTVFTVFRKTWMMSAAAAMLIAVSWFVIHLFNSPVNVDYLANSSEEELLEYVSTYAYQFDQNSLATVMSEDEISSLDIVDDMDEETSDLLIELFE